MYYFKCQRASDTFNIRHVIPGSHFQNTLQIQKLISIFGLAWQLHLQEIGSGNGSQLRRSLVPQHAELFRRGSARVQTNTHQITGSGVVKLPMIRSPSKAESIDGSTMHIADHCRANSRASARLRTHPLNRLFQEARKERWRKNP